MAVQSGNGGYIKVNTVRYDIAKWTLDKDPRNVESGTSAQTGTRYTAVKTDPSWTLALPYDTSAAVETAGLIEGAIITIAFKLGAGTLFYTITNSTVGHIKPVCDANGDVVRYELDGKGGDVTGPA